jgi:hypothetical protein
MMLEAVMFATNVIGRVVASVTGLRDTGSRDRSHGDERNKSLGVTSLHWVLPFWTGFVTGTMLRSGGS